MLLWIKCLGAFFVIDFAIVIVIVAVAALFGGGFLVALIP